MLKTFNLSGESQDEGRLRVLVIDDDILNAESMAFVQEDWVVSHLETPQPIFNGNVDLALFDVVFVDLIFHPKELEENGFHPDSPFLGFKLLDWFKTWKPDKPVIVLSARLGNPIYDRKLRASYPGVLFFPKPLLFEGENIRRIMKHIKRFPKSKSFQFQRGGPRF